MIFTSISDIIGYGGENMIKTTAMLLDELHSYRNPRDKLARMVQNKECIPIIQGLYETDSSTPGYRLANCICTPSYLSFEFALSYHGLIPEAVYNFTSATFEKKKKKIYKTPFGIFTYRDVPSAVYPYGITCFSEQGYAIQIASPEKALCDELYIQSPVASQGELKELMFDGLRIDWDAFCKLSVEDVAFLNGKYHCTNIQKLQKIMEKIA
ncbi:type IV toxin-antitoxin system AbiEi family antitoxin domain-containing protein [Gemmiger formicilis]|uniref:type IV toxin-antitoxin system AbiEi family antitoxin domain-containing protein n=1 Tax=Gemmiger formicilis TaxID=745368 RepID=UPI0035200ECD